MNYPKRPDVALFPCAQAFLHGYVHLKQQNLEKPVQEAASSSDDEEEASCNLDAAPGRFEGISRSNRFPATDAGPTKTFSKKERLFQPPLEKK